VKGALLAITLGGGTGLPPADASSPPYAVTVELGAKPTYLLRGDFERPDTVGLVFDPDWGDLLHDLVAHIAASGAQPWLIFDDEDSDEDIDAWYSGNVDLVALRVRHFQAPVDSVWIRDWGPIQSWDRRGRPHFLDAPYSDDRPDDDAVPAEMARHMKLPIDSFPYAIDGGALASNGQGLCASTMEFFVHWELSPSFEMLDELGCERLVLVPALIDEDTRHVDLIMQFVDADTLVVQRVDASVDPANAARLDQAAAAMIDAAAGLGLDLAVERIPMRPPQSGVAYAYVNGLPLSDRYLMPVFGDADFDREARLALGTAMPDKTIVDIDVAAIGNLGGALHCLSLGFNRKPRARTRRG